jgi:hypothetical protein
VQWGVRLGLATASIALLGVADASAAVRYAEPGGTGPEPCLQSSPCSFFQAADASSGATIGDEVVLAVGVYSDEDGDLGPDDTITLEPFIAVHGETGKAARPIVVVKEETETGLTLSPSSVVSRIDLENRSAKYGVYVKFGLLRESIVRSNRGAPTTGPDLYACKLGFTPAAIADSVCLATGEHAAAVGAQHTLTSSNAVELRNVTALSTGPGGVGVHVFASGPFTYTVRTKSTIASGTELDVLAYGRGNPAGTPATGATLKIELDHSNFSTTTAFNDNAAGATTTITGPEEAGNQAEPEPEFGIDGYHQLPTSATVDAGETYGGVTSTTDVDGRARTVGPKPDIGADELGHPTETSVVCDPATVNTVTGPTSTTCTATVTDTAEGFLTPTGVVVFGSLGGAYFSGDASCALQAPAFGRTASCQIAYTPPSAGALAGTHSTYAYYDGDQFHERSEGLTTISIATARACPGIGCNGEAVCLCPGGEPAYRVRILAKPPRKSAKRRVKVAFVSVPAGAKFECKLDRKPFKQCRSPYKPSVAVGTHTVKVRILGEPATTKSFLVDRLPD